MPRYDRLTDPGADNVGLAWAEWSYGPEKRFFGSYSLSVNQLGRWADGMVATASLQDIQESRIQRRFNSNNRDNRVEEVSVFGLNIDFNKELNGHKIRYGFDGQYNVLRSTATRTNVTNFAISGVSTRYPDGDNVMGLYALYITHTKEIGNNLYINDGLRLGYSTLFSSFNSKVFFAFPFESISQENLYGSGNLGLVFTPSLWKFSLMGSTGYRVPNFDDLGKIFDTVTGTNATPGTLIVPNSNLGPEKTLNIDIGATRLLGSRGRIEAVAFYTKFLDAIVVRPTSFNGQQTIVFNGFPANVVSSQNASDAYLYG
ncbi:MAG: TonB-dependent receptor, partial [Flammeovirgaceae bacterium]